MYLPPERPKRRRMAEGWPVNGGGQHRSEGDAGRSIADEAHKRPDNNSHAHVMEVAIKRSTAETETIESKEQSTITHKSGENV